MYLEEIRDYCLTKNAVTEDMPFDDETLVFKVCGKIFALLSLDGVGGLNLKCEPVKALELRERYDFIIPGYHMNKKYWNTVTVTGEITEKQLKDWIKHSYNEVMRGISKKRREIFA